MTSDTYILYGIVFTFIMLGVLLPYIYDDFNADTSEFSTNDIITGDTDVSATDVLLSVFSMFFWTFTLPFWLEAVLTIFRIILAVLIYRNIRGVG